MVRVEFLSSIFFEDTVYGLNGRAIGNTRIVVCVQCSLSSLPEAKLVV